MLGQCSDHISLRCRSADLIKIIVMTRDRCRVATRNHRTTPKVQYGLSVLIRRRHLEGHDARCCSIGLGFVLAQSNDFRSGVERIADVHAAMQDQAAIK